MKFKKGDKVRCLNGSGYGFFTDEIYVANGKCDNTYFRTDNDARNKPNGYCPKNFILVSSGCTLKEALESGKRFKQPDWGSFLDKSSYIILMKNMSIYGIMEDILEDNYILEKNPSLKLESLQHTIEVQDNGDMKVGCQLITSKDIVLLKKFLQEL